MTSETAVPGFSYGYSDTPTRRLLVHRMIITKNILLKYITLQVMFDVLYIYIYIYICMPVIYMSIFVNSINQEQTKCKYDYCLLYTIFILCILDRHALYACLCAFPSGPYPNTVLSIHC